MRSTGSPFLNSMMVGSASILYLDAMFGYFSVLILTSFTLSGPTLAASWGSTWVEGGADKMNGKVRYLYTCI